MKVEINPKEGLRATVPIDLKIKDTDNMPKVYVKGLGEVDVLKMDDGYQAVFWSSSPGTYEVVVEGKNKAFTKVLEIGEQKYLTFGQEFGFFTVLFILFSMGLILWIRKIKRL